MTKGLEELAASGDTNILKTDAELSAMIRRLDNVKKYKSFQKWKSNFLARLDQFLFDAGRDPAEKASTAFDQSLNKMVKSTTKVQNFMEKGDLGEDKKTVKASLALNEMCNKLTTLNDEVENIIPFSKQEEKKRGFTKFHLGAVLIQHGFTQYVTMEVIRDALADIGTKLENVADRQQHDLFYYYQKQVIRFCDIMADLNLYDIMKKCIEFANPPDEEESSSEEEPISIQVVIETYDGKTMRLELDPTETIGNVKEAIGPGSGIEPDEQVLQFDGNTLADNDSSLEHNGIEDGATLWLEPRNINVNIQMPDGSTHPLKIPLYDTQAEIKKRIEVQLGMPADEQVLKYGGRELPDDGKTVKDLRIQEGDTIKVGVFQVPVTVNTMDGKKIQVMVNPKEPLAEIKKKLQEESGLSPDNQNLFLDGEVLDDDDKPAAEYGIQAGTELDLEPKSINVNVKMPDGTTETIAVKPSDTADMIKESIAEQTGMAVPKQVVQFKGKEVVGDSTVKDLGIREGNILKVDIRKVPITVNTMDGKSIKVMIDPTEPVGEIKKQIADESGVPADNQRLFLNREELADDNKAAEDYDIEAGTELDMEPKVIKVNVTMPDGKTQHTVELAPSDTSDEIKDKIAKKTGIKAPRQIVKHHGNELPKDGSTVKDLGIREGDNLDIEIFKVPITVDTMDGKKIKVMVDPTEKLGEIKKQLEDESGVPANNQRLFMNGEELEDDEKPAEEYGIQAGSELDLEPKTIKVNVEMPDGSTQIVEIEPSDTSEQVKEKIEKETGMVAPRQVVTFNGKELPNDGTTVKDLGIREGDNLKVDIKKIPITVNTMDGKQIKVMIDPTEPVGEIKKQLEDESGVPANNQRLFKNGEELEDDKKPAAEYGIEADAELEMEPKTIQVNVVAPDGQTHVVEITPSDTSDKVKEKIEQATGIEVPRQVVSHNGKELPNDGSSVKDMGIREGDDLTVDIFKVPITVNSMDGKQINLMVEPSKPLTDIKEMLKDASGIAPDNQRLLKEGEELDDDNKAAQDYDIKAGTVLDLEPKKITVSVTMPSGKKHKIEIEPNDTSEGIKMKIEEETGMEVPKQVLKFNGKEIPKGQTARDAGIREGDNVDVEILKVPVTVNTMDGKSIQIMVDPTDKMSAIKSMLEEESGLPPINQRLFMQKVELADDNRMASGYGIQAGSVLDLEPRMFSVNVEMPDGAKHEIQLAPSDTSDNIKDKIEAASGMAVSRQVVKFDGKELPGFGKTARDMGLREGSDLQVSIFKIPIVVKTHDDKVVKLEVEPIDTIETVKNMLEPEVGYSPSKQILKKGVDELNMLQKTVDECGIKAEDELTVEPRDDPIIFVDIKSETLFAVDREDVVKREVLTPRNGNKLDFTEAANDSATKDKLGKAMKDAPHLGVATQVVVQAIVVEDYDLHEAEKVKNKWGVNLKKRTKNQKGEELIFVDPKTGAVGELSRKKYVEMGFITPAPRPPGKAQSAIKDFIKESEKDQQKYDKYRDFIREIYGIASHA